jgi:hypothetical protein
MDKLLEKLQKVGFVFSSDEQEGGGCGYDVLDCPLLEGLGS